MDMSFLSGLLQIVDKIRIDIKRKKKFQMYEFMVNMVELWSVNID